MERLVAFDSVRQQLLARCPAVTEVEEVALEDAAGRRVAADIVSDGPWPATRLAASDGLAVRAEDSIGASPYNPLPLSPGSGAAVEPGDSLPPATDAVAPWDLVMVDGASQALIGEVDGRQGVCRPGQLLRQGDRVLAAGHRLGAADIALLVDVGRSSVTVSRQPVVQILFVCAGGIRTLERLLRPSLAADGAEIRATRADSADDLAAGLRQAAAGADLVLVIGGNGEAPGAIAPAAVARTGTLHAHQLALRPGRAAGFGTVADTPVLLVPPEPVAAHAVCELLAGAAIRSLAAAAEEGLPHCTLAAPLARKIVSPLGELGYIRATTDGERVDPQPAGTDLDLPLLSRTDGFVLVAPESEGHPPGAVVTLYRDRV